MEISEVIRRISRYQANVENLQLEKTRLLNEIDALDQEALKIKEYKWQAQNRFKCRVDNIIYIRNQRGKAEERFATRVAKVRSLDSYKSRGIRGISEKLGAINSLNASSSYVFKAMIMIETMIANIDRGIREREYRINEIDCELGNYSEKIEKLKIRKRRLERE